MSTVTKAQRKSPSLPENPLARTAIAAIEQINEETKEKKLAQLEALQTAKAAIHSRMDELNHQLAQIEGAIASIQGTPTGKGKRVRRNLDEERARVVRWMSGRKGQKFAAGDLVKEVPELEGVVMSVFLKPLVQEGKVKTDTSEGIRRAKYFVAD